MTSSALRQIEPLEIDGIPAIDPGPPPRAAWVPPQSLLVDDAYQRDISRRTMENIMRIMREFAWSRFKWPTCVQAADGALHVIDGQHSAIAAATLGIAQIPVTVVDAATLAERAGAFIGINKHRSAVHPLEMHRALVVAGDEASADLQAVLDKAGVRLALQARGTALSAISTLHSILTRRGPARLRIILETLVAAQCPAIEKVHLRAAEGVYAAKPQADPADLADAIRIEGDTAPARALAQSAIMDQRQHEALRDIWLKRMKK